VAAPLPIDAPIEDRSILATLRGIATAVFGRDKRTLDPVIETNIGNSSPLELPASASNPTSKTIFEARARNESSPELMTIYIQTAENHSGVVDIKAKIEWGVGGAQHFARIDCQNGATVTVDGTYVRVSVEVFGSSLNVYPLTGSIIASASISYDPRGTGTPRSNTFSVGTRFPVNTEGEIIIAREGAAFTGVGPIATLKGLADIPYFQRIFVYASSFDPAGPTTTSVPVQILISGPEFDLGFLQAANIVQEIPLPGNTSAISVNSPAAGVGVFVTIFLTFEFAL
jgi:hypothetical protein